MYVRLIRTALPDCMDTDPYRNTLIVFGKAPIAGQVKTRLIPELGKDRALHIYQTLLTHTLNVVSQIDIAATELHIVDDINHDIIQDLFRSNSTELFQQCDGDLGKRMQQAFQSALQENDAVVLIGSDCPGLSATIIKQAFHFLHSGDDVILGPAFDGGYYLIGMKQLYSSLFNDITWSSETVLDETRERCRQLHCRWSELACLTDVDTVADMKNYEWLTMFEDRLEI